MMMEIQEKTNGYAAEFIINAVDKIEGYKKEMERKLGEAIDRQEQAEIMNKETLDAHKEIKKLHEEGMKVVVLFPAEADALRELVHSKAEEVVEDLSDMGIKEEESIMKCRIWAKVNKVFDVRSYKRLPRKRLDGAKKWIDNIQAEDFVR